MADIVIIFLSFLVPLVLGMLLGAWLSRNRNRDAERLRHVMWTMLALEIFESANRDTPVPDRNELHRKVHDRLEQFGKGTFFVPTELRAQLGPWG